MNTKGTLKYLTLALVLGFVVWMLYDLSANADLTKHFQKQHKVQQQEKETRIQQQPDESEYNQLAETAALESMIYAKTSKCEPENNILLVKTHKTGGSTLTNMLNRYADEQDLAIALPRKGLSRFEWPFLFSNYAVDKQSLREGSANVLTNHARLEREEMDKVMEEGTFYISILRNPITQYESMFYYMELYKLFKLKFSANPLDEFMVDPEGFIKTLPKKPVSLGLLKNGMFFDLGFDNEKLEEIGLQQAVIKLEDEVDFFLIVEYFDVCLILLKRRMCWTFDDILYFQMNQRQVKFPVSKQPTKERMKEWNRGDLFLYQHFNQTLWKKVKAEGMSFWDELTEFQVFKNHWHKVQTTNHSER